jgi:hypothetical protein
MRRIFHRTVFLQFLSATFVLLPAQTPPRATSGSVVAHEATARLTLQEKSSRFSIELSTNSPKPLSATLTAKIVNSSENTIAQASVPLEITSTPRRAEVPLNWIPTDGLTDSSSSRLFYEIRLEGGSTPVLSGILSPYTLIPDVFELHFLGLDAIDMNRTYVARVWATRPDSPKPVSGVALTALIGEQDEADTSRGAKVQARTNMRGEAQLTLHLHEVPGTPDDQTVDLEIKGNRGNFQNAVTASLHLWRRAAILFCTDKPLYQPEQTLHMRALLLDDQRRAWAKQGLRFVVRDPDDTIVFSTDAESSRFGIASADWTIPSSQKMGNYRVTAELSGDPDSRELLAGQIVRITRYELPTFSVNVHSDQPYYLPGQNGELTVAAAYLFGKPVLRGHVRVVRESSREWSYHDQEWEAEEGESVEGELDAKNEYHVTLDLSKEHAALAEEDWKRFQDIRYAAYLTDASSRRTQERHFDLRISRDAIHLYVPNVGGSLFSGLPPVFYIFSTFADGTPAPAEVLVNLYAQDPADTTPSKPPAVPFANTRVRTNRYGIARVHFPAPLHKDQDVDRIYATFDAKTIDGRTGKHLESYTLLDDLGLRITPDKVVLKPGDPIEAQVEASVPGTRVRVELIQTDTQTILGSQDLKLSRGPSQLAFAPNKQFVGELVLAAYPLGVEIDPYAPARSMDAVSVLFPQPTKLQLEVKPTNTTYRPGEAARVNLRVRGPQGEPTEGALGLLVYDQALEELARNEASLSTDHRDDLDPRLGFRGFSDSGDSLAGISVKQLLDRTPGDPVTPDLELLAEALVSTHNFAPLRWESSDAPRYFNQIFQKQIHAVLDPILPAMNAQFTSSGHFPADDVELTKVLNLHGMEGYRLADPWGRPYHVSRSYRGRDELLEFRSEGPDKTPDTPDDFTALSMSRPFFEADAARLRSILDAYHARTGGYIHDQATFEAACRQEHTSPSSFVDPWGTPYRFEFGVLRENFTIGVSSAGPDKRFQSSAPDYSRDYDDVLVSTLNTFYFQEPAQRIASILLESSKSSSHFPENEREFRAVLQQHGIDWSTYRDPWDRPYRVVAFQEAGYGDQVTLRAYGQNVSRTQTPVTRTLKGLSIVSDGPDFTPNTQDDFVLARFTSPFSEESGGLQDKAGSQPKLQPVYSGSSGALRVIVKDPSGAVISNAKISLTNQATGIIYTGNSNDQGLCLLSNLPAGTYRVLVESPGFRSYVLTNIPILSSNVTDVDVMLNVGTSSETVEVTAQGPVLETSVASLATLAPGIALTTKSRAASGKIDMSLATPRLREYFPETLLWQPEVLTDRVGHIAVKVPLADSITTWKVSVIASTLDGHIGTASADLRAFLPFFAELDPPQVLTVGDEIHLPVTLRNYLDKSQTVELDWAAEPWSQTLSPRNARIDVPAGDYAQNSFSFRAALPMRDAKQRLTAVSRSSANDSDAIEKKLRIHADGQERILQASSIFLGNTSFSLDIPAKALPGSIESELVLYPNLISHLSDAIEGILQRPYGCAEQTMSSAYPSLLWLQLQKTQKIPSSPLDARARHYLNLAYAKLLGYREPDGGISYWGKGDPHVSLTAYALRFLTEASEFIEVDPEVIAATRRWLLQQVGPQGAWMERSRDGKFFEPSAPYITAYVLEVLSRDLQHRDSKDKEVDPERQAVHNAISYFSTRVPAASDPYDIALLALAKFSANEDASQEITALLAQEHPEGEASYWDLFHNTIFYGWGYTGRIETTAVVLDALATARRQGRGGPELDRALNRGTIFLLKNKDHYGVWYSTQATVEVLQSLMCQLASAATGEEQSRAQIRILVDGKPGPQLSVSADLRQLAPVRADLTPFLSPGHHSIEIKDGPATSASAYANATYYLPWSDSSVTASSVRSGDAESLRYSVKFDHTAASTGDSIRCTVHAERVGFHGYGMLLAEVGLPPGADVDRSSLETATANGWEIQSYEIQPDRIVFYLWPQAGGTTFFFSLKPRFAMTASSAESILYDYYNPQARASVPPGRFVIH